jgi:5-methylcytosine-specific restriction enzyme B
MILADRIRLHVLTHSISPARNEGRTMVVVRAGDVHADLGLENRMPAVCSALDADKFLSQAGVTLGRRSGPTQGSNAEWVFDL